MGLAPIDLQPEILLSRTSGGSFNPPAIHYVLSDEELLERKLTLYQGSGGHAASVLNITRTGGSVQGIPALQPSLAHTVAQICSTFDLTKEELAKVCKIQSKKTLYNWINGEAKPRREAMNRLFDLLMIAKAWASSGLPATRELLSKPVVQNQSLLDLLEAPVLDKELIIFAGSRLALLQPSATLADPFA